MALEFPENSVLASHYVKKALPIMIKNNIPPNPCNFALWYTYVSKRDRGLQISLDETLSQQGTCPEGVSRELFKKHIMSEEVEFQQNMQDTLSNVIDDLNSNVSETVTGADVFAHALADSLETLESDQELDEVKATLKGLIETAKETSTLANNFQTQLRSAEDEIASLKAQLDQNEKEVYLDALTKIGNRRAFDKRLVELFQDGSAATLVLVDLDHFKKLNDTYGHLMGDKVLQGVGQVMQKVCPENTLAARYGGEEFAFLVEGDVDVGATIAEQTRVMLSKLLLRKKNSEQVIDNITASFGVAQKCEGDYPEQLIEKADKALYQAKESGRNRVELAAA